jgi:hypothetical protein
MHGMHTAISKVENSAQVLSCYLKFVHAVASSGWTQSHGQIAAFLPKRFSNVNEEKKVLQDDHRNTQLTVVLL